MRSDVVRSATRPRRRSSTSTRRRCTSSTRRRRKPTCGTWRAFAQEIVAERRHLEQLKGRQAERPDQADRRLRRRPATTWRSRCRRRMGGNKDMPMTVTLAGPIWIVKDAPGAADYIALLQGGGREGLDLQRPARGEGPARPGQGDGGDVQAVRRDRRHRLRDRHADQDGRRQRADGRHAGARWATCRRTTMVDVVHDRPAGRRSVCAAGGIQAESRRRDSLRTAVCRSCSSFSLASHAPTRPSSPSSSVRRGPSWSRPRASTRGSTPTTPSDRWRGSTCA